MRTQVLHPTAHRLVAQDARAFVQSLQYWLGGNAANLEGLLLNTAQRYVPALKGVDFAVAEPQLFPDVGIWHPLAPSAASNSSCDLTAQHSKLLLVQGSHHSTPYSIRGVWVLSFKDEENRGHRAEACAATGCAAMYDDVKEYLNWYDTRSDLRLPADAPIVGLVLQRSHLVTGDEGHYSGVVSEMEARGAKVRLAPLRVIKMMQPAV